MTLVNCFGKSFVRTSDFTTLRTKWGDADNKSIAANGAGHWNISSLHRCTLVRAWQTTL